MKPGANRSNGQGTAVDLIGGPIMKNLLIFMLPILISYVFQQLYNAVDTAIVGHFLGEQSLAAVGANVAIFDLMVMFAQSLGNGLCIVVSRAYGAGDEGKLRKSVAGSLVIGAGTVAVMTVLSLFGRWRTFGSLAAGSRLCLPTTFCRLCCGQSGIPRCRWFF